MIKLLYHTLFYNVCSLKPFTALALQNNVVISQIWHFLSKSDMKQFKQSQDTLNHPKDVEVILGKKSLDKK